MNYSATNTTMSEADAALEQLMKKEISRRQRALVVARADWENKRKEEEEMLKAAQLALEEEHQRIKQYEYLFDQEAKLLKSMPMSQQASLLHNALLSKHRKEGMLIEGSFNANKMAKKDLREERMRRIKSTQDKYEREITMIEKTIDSLRHMAEVAGFFFDDVVIKQGTIDSAASPQESRDQLKAATRSTHSSQSVDPVPMPSNGDPARTLTMRLKQGKDSKQPAEKRINRCADCKVALSGRTKKLAVTSPTAIAQLTLEVKERYMHEIQTELEQNYRKDYLITTGIDTLEDDWSRITKIKRLLALFGDTEYKKEWKEAEYLVREQLKSIQDELEIFKVHRSELWDPFYRYHKATHGFFDKQLNFYAALEQRAEGESSTHSGAA